MANIYVRSTDGNNGDNGSTWALAKATIAGAAAIDAAGDTIWFSQSHSESTAANVSVNLLANQRLLCGNDAAEPPTSLATGAVIAVTGNFNSLSIACGAGVYVYGLDIRAGTGADNSFPSLTGSGEGRFKNCAIRTKGTGASSEITVSGSGVLIEDLTIEVGNANSKLALQNGATIEGGSYTGATLPTSAALQLGGTVRGFDFSNLSASINIDSGGAGGKLVNCKLPASWSGSLTSSSVAAGVRIAAYNCDGADTNYRLWIETYAGSIRDETTLVRSGGASDGATPISWKFVTNASARFGNYELTSDEIVRWNETVGSAITVTVEILHDPGSPGSLNDDEIWLEVMYLGTSGVPLGAFSDDAKADVLAANAPQASSSAAWTTTGMSNPTTQKLSVTFTPREVGFIHATVHMAKPSYKVYVCPKIDVT